MAQHLLSLPPVSEPEQATILAALRFYQKRYSGGDVTIDDISTDGGKHIALENGDIDDLCERINMESLPEGSR